MTNHDQTLLDLLAGARMAVLATLKRDGRPQLSDVLYAYGPESGRIRISVTADRAKTANAARDPRVSLHVRHDSGWAYAVAEGDAELGAVVGEADDAAAEELVDLYRTLAGEHENWADYRESLVRERRQVLSFRISHVYGMPPRG